MSNVPGSPDAGAANRAGNAAPQGAAWSPLRVPLFRALWTATTVSGIGTWAQEAGGPWLMRILTPKPVMVGLMGAAGNLPICLLSLPAGAMADVLDRKRLLIFTQLWMLLASGALGVLTLAGIVKPPVLLGFTFILGVGTALSGPAFQAIVPELVPPGDMPLAIALNSVALNVSRAVGPAAFMLSVKLAGGGVGGCGASFLFNAASFVGVAWVLYEWKRIHQHGHLHTEDIFGAVRTGFRYTRYSPALQAVLIRVALFISCAVAMWGQLPVIARDQLGEPETGYAILMACLGAGAVIGVTAMPRLQRRLSVDGMVTACTGAFALGLGALSRVPARHAWLADLVMLFIGFNWVIIPTNFNVATQKSVPGWVKGRALSMYLTTLFGTWALGSAVWGWVAQQTSISTALLLASILLACGLLLVNRFPLTLNAGLDLMPAFKGPPPSPPVEMGSHTGGIQVAIHYAIAGDRQAQFAAVMQQLRLQRLRNGALDWRLKPGPDGQFIERFSFPSWNEHGRHYARTTKADFSLEQRARELHAAPHAPVVRHALLAAPMARPALRDRAAEFAFRVVDEYGLWQRRLCSVARNSKSEARIFMPTPKSEARNPK